MYAAVPRMTPISVSAGLVIVGETVALAPVTSIGIQSLREPEVQHLHCAVGSQLDIRRLEIAVDDSALVSRFERLGDLARDRHRLVDGDRPLGDAIGERRSFDQFEYERLHVCLR